MVDGLTEVMGLRAIRHLNGGVTGQRDPSGSARLLVGQLRG